jgi:hypothetical protein
MGYTLRIDDPPEEAGRIAIEVTIQFDDGSRRWCFFVQKDAVGEFGDLIDGTQTRVLYGAKHMVVVPEVTEDVIRRFVKMVYEQGELENVTLSVDEAG